MLGREAGQVPRRLTALALGDEIAAWPVLIAWPVEIAPKGRADGKTMAGRTRDDCHPDRYSHTIVTIETKKTHVVERNKLGRFPFPPRYSVSGFSEGPRGLFFVSVRQGFVLCFAAPLKGAAKHKTKPGARCGGDCLYLRDFRRCPIATLPYSSSLTLADGDWLVTMVWVCASPVPCPVVLSHHGGF